MRLLLLPLLLMTACTDAPADAPTDASTETLEPVTTEEAAETAVGEAETSDFFVGDWVCQGGDAPFEQVSFGVLDNESTYSTFVGDRPFGNGTWAVDGSTLTMEGTEGTSTFTDADVVEGILMLTDDTGTTFACNNLPISP